MVQAVSVLAAKRVTEGVTAGPRVDHPGREIANPLTDSQIPGDPLNMEPQEEKVDSAATVKSQVTGIRIARRRQRMNGKVLSHHHGTDAKIEEQM